MRIHASSRQITAYNPYLTQIKSLNILQAASRKNFNLKKYIFYIVIQMFISTENKYTISNRNKKFLNYNYRHNLIETTLINKQFTMFFYFDYISSEMQRCLKQTLLEHNLQSKHIQKKIFENIVSQNYKFFLNITKNNTLIIYSKINAEFTYTLITKLNLIKGIHFIGAWINSQFLRPSELKKISQSSSIYLQKLQCQILNLPVKILKKTLFFKKTYLTF